MAGAVWWSMEVGGVRCGCPRGFSPLSTPSSPPRCCCCHRRHHSGLTALPSPRSPAPFWRPWLPGPAVVSGAARLGSKGSCRGPGWGGGGSGPAAGVTSALSSPAPQPPRAGARLPQAGAVRAPRQVSAGGAPLPPFFFVFYTWIGVKVVFGWFGLFAVLFWAAGPCAGCQHLWICLIFKLSACF